MSKLQVVEATSAEDVNRLDLPDRVQLPLAEIVGDAREGLLALSVRVGLAVLQETMEWEVDRVVGPRAFTIPTGSLSGTGTHRGR
jgi:putative transposase